MLGSRYERATQTGRGVYRWVIGTPTGACVGTFVGLLLLILLPSLAIRPLSVHGWLRAAQLFLPVACLMGGVVWVRDSRWSGQLKPEWLSWYGLFGLTVQVLAAGVLIYAMTANRLGYLHSTPGAKPWPVDPYVYPWSFLALATAVGIYRNCWWAYFFEVAVLCLLVVAAVTDPTPPVPRHELISLPFMNEFWAVVEWLGFISLNWWLIRRGFTRFREERVAG